MVLRTFFALPYFVGLAVMGFVFGRLPKPTPALVPRRVGLVVLVVCLFMGQAPWTFRVGATCATLVVAGIAWYFGARERKRDGFAPFAHPPLPEGHTPRLDERVERLFTPRRWMLGLVAFLSLFLLLVGNFGTSSEVWNGTKVLFFLVAMGFVAFVGGRFPKTFPSRAAGLFASSGYPLVILEVSRLEWSTRLRANCAMVVVMVIAWYFGVLDRERDGIPAFAHPPYPEGHKPKLGERLVRLITPARGVLVIMLMGIYSSLLRSDIGTHAERAAEARMAAEASRENAPR